VNDLDMNEWNDREFIDEANSATQENEDARVEGPLSQIQNDGEKN
jgi:hypothetical protein